MECGKLTAKLRDAVPVCFIVDGKEVKRYKNIEIPDASSRAYCPRFGRKNASERAEQRKRRKRKSQRM